MPTAKSPQETPQVSPLVLAGRTMRMMREAHHIGLREMAGLVGISPSHLSRIESGQRAAGDDLTKRITDIIGELPAPERAS